MARQIPLDQLDCDREDGQFAVAFCRWEHDYAGPAPSVWVALCSDDVGGCLDDPGFVYVRFRDDPAAPADAPNDTDDHPDDDPALKFPDDGADN